MALHRIILGVIAAGFVVALAAVALLRITPAAEAAPPVYTGIVKGVAVGGYDPVALFTDGKPVKGNKDLTTNYDGATWRFASAANRDAFQADPAKYAPQYGGYCAYAVSKGSTAKGDPQAWTVHDGKLYLNYNKNVRAMWAKDIPGNVKKGDANWPAVLEK
ncbi:MAG: YHS domain-containing (seleno)protein [Hyphomicrobium sp.]